MYSQEKAVIDFRQGMSRKNILKKYGEHGIFLVDMYKKWNRRYFWNFIYS